MRVLRGLAGVALLACGGIDPPGTAADGGAAFDATADGGAAFDATARADAPADAPPGRDASAPDAAMIDAGPVVGSTCTAKLVIDHALLPYPPGMELHVDAAAATGGDGSISTPYRTLGEAVEAADRHGVTWIRVAEGAYVETVHPDDEGLSLVIVGGYLAGTAFAVRDPSVAPTRIEGADPLAPVFHVYNAPLLVIDGLEITGGTSGIVALGYTKGRAVTITNSHLHHLDVVSVGSDRPSDGQVHGHAISVNGASVVISNNHIHDNRGASRGAGIYLTSSGDEAGQGLVANNVIAGNVATGSSIHGAGAWVSLDGTFRDNLVVGNRMETSDHSGPAGGLIVVGHFDVRIERSVFMYNEAATGGGAIEIDEGGRAAIVNCLVANNRSGRNGGGIAVDGESNGTPSTLTVMSSTIAGNESGYGGGLSAWGAEVTIVSSIFADNTATQPGTNDLDLNAESSIAISYSSFAYQPPAGLAFVVGPGNLSVADPMFESPAAADYRLTAASTLRDVGAGAPAPNDDLDGRPRPQGGGIDLGAYELGTCGLAPTRSW